MLNGAGDQVLIQQFSYAAGFDPTYLQPGFDPTYLQPGFGPIYCKVLAKSFGRSHWTNCHLTVKWLRHDRIENK